MAEGADQEQKTHDPAGKRLEEARARGEVAVSSEMRHAVMFLAMLIVLGGMGVWAFSRLSALLVSLLGGAARLTPSAIDWVTVRIASWVKSLAGGRPPTGNTS